MDEKQLNHEIDELTTDPVDKLLQEKKPASSGKAIAVLALLVAMAAVSATAWQWWQTRLADPADLTQAQAFSSLQETQQRLVKSVAAFETQLNATQSPVDAAELSRRNERLKAVENQLAGLQGQSGEDQASVSAMQGSVRSLEQRISATESGLVSLATNSQNSGVELEIAEIDFLLRAASERLQLFLDPNAADLALQAADVQIEALNDPMFLSVRQRIASARQALAAVPRIDHVQLSARLTEMQSKVSDLPFRGEVQTQAEPEPAEDSGWWASFKQTMSSLVTVRRRVPEEQSLLSLEDKDYLRQGLWLQFESARLALMRDDDSIYTGSLDRVAKTVDQFFLNGSTQVQALLLEVSALKQVDIAPQMPDISAPWTKLRQLRDSRRLLQSATPVEIADPVEIEESVESEEAGE
jgi:uroporphyrin-3 C-methyltransferase